MTKVFKPFAGLWLVCLALFIAPTAPAKTALDPVEGQKQAQELVAKLLSLQPTENSTNYGTLKIIPKDKKKSSRVPVEFIIEVKQTNWLSIYKTVPTNSQEPFTLIVSHQPFSPNRLITTSSKATNGAHSTAEAFANSDFSAADLALEFLYWPQQRILYKEIKRSCGCSVLESVNPNPQPAGYSRILTWIDNDSLGIVQAQAYDAKGKVLKEFIPKSVTKVNGQWQVDEIEMDNVQTESRTLIVFDLDR